jgi:hypothetical protein
MAATEDRPCGCVRHSVTIGIVAKASAAMEIKASGPSQIVSFSAELGRAAWGGQAQFAHFGHLPDKPGAAREDKEPDICCAGSLAFTIFLSSLLDRHVQPPVDRAEERR